MVHSSRILAATVALAAVVTLGQSPAMARSTTFTRTFATPQGAVTQSVVKSYTPSTGARSETQTTTLPSGRSATSTVSSTPDGRGGVVDARSTTTFSGKVYGRSRQFGP